MIQFQPLEKKDVDTVTSLMSEFYAIDNYPFVTTKATNLFEEFLANDNLGKCWLLLWNQEIVGYLILTFVFSFEYQGKIAFLDELYIQPKAQGQGIGKSAVAFAKIQSEELGLKLLYLEVEEHNLSAQQLYLKSGFTIHPRNLMKHKL
jgi:ribosomal protein S18 acetylase RimI-like enzyme